MANARSDFLRTVLFVDAATCLACGLAMSLAAAPLARLLALPAALVLGAGLALLPIAALMAFVARRFLQPAAVWLVVVGNLAWGVGCLWLLGSGVVAPTMLGEAFLVAQAVVVFVAAGLEIRGVLRISAPVPA